MSNFLNSINMSMPIPVAGVDPGPDWALNINSSLTIVDLHDHSAGKGVPVTPNGLNISSDLTFMANNAVAIRSVRFTPQGSPLALVSDIGCLYEVNDDLYYNDGLGNKIRITQGGSLAGAAGTITGLPSGTASASYAAGTFTFQSATATGANIDGASFILRNNSANSKGLTLFPPNAMGADYSLTLPSLPVANNTFLTMDTSGNIGSVVVVDNATVEISSSTLRVKAAGIGSTQIAAGAVLQSNLYTRTTSATAGAGDVAVSVCSNTFSTGSTAEVPVMSGISIVTTGRPVMVSILSDDTSNGSYAGAMLTCNGTNGATISVRFDGAVDYFYTRFGGAAGAITDPVLQWLHVPSAGTHTYQLFVNSNTGATVLVYGVKLVAYEL